MTSSMKLSSPKLYSYSVTSNGIKMSLLMHAMSLDITVVTVDLPNGEQKDAEFLTLNPNAKIPVLVNGNDVIYESNAIAHYLVTVSDNKHGSSLWPEDPSLQSKVLQWMFWQVSTWTKAVSPYSFQRVLLPFWGFTSNKKPITQEDPDFHRVANALDNALENRIFLVADHFTLADICLSADLLFVDEANIPLESYTNITRWLSRIREQSWWNETKLNAAHFLTNKHVYA